MPNPTADHGRPDRLGTLHKLVTLLLAVATTVLGVWQFKLQHRLDEERAKLQAQVGRTKLVNEMLTRVEGYLDKQENLSPEDETRIRVALSKIAAEVNIEESGSLQNQSDLIRQVPLYLALLTENHEPLVIDASHDAMILWVPLAVATADPKIRETAIEALERIGELSADSLVVAEAIDSLLDLAGDWRIEDSRDEVAEALASVLARVDSDDLKESEKLAEAVRRARSTLDTLIATTTPSIDEIAEGAAYTATDGPLLPASTKIAPELTQQVTRVASELLAEDYDQIPKLIDDLESEDKERRRDARSRLASIGQEAVPALLQALERNSESYQTRLGVVTTLLLMQQPVSLTADEASLVTDLLGDEDPTIRKNAANFLIGVRDPDTVRAVFVRLTNNLSRTDNPNQLYNTVVVLCELGNRLAEAQPDLRESVRGRLQHAKQELEQQGTWTKTVAQIEKCVAP